MPKRHSMEIVERRQVETVNRPCLSYGCPASRGAVMQRKERKTLPTPVLSRAGAYRAAEPISKVRPDAEEILRLILARLDDMKAENTFTVDLTGKSTIVDTMVVSPAFISWRRARIRRRISSASGRTLEMGTA